MDTDSPAVLLKDGTPILLSRTGYTGEFGFEIFIDIRHLEKIWSELLDRGGDKITPCGLASRDSLRAGAVLPLSHQDIGDWPFIGNPWGFALPLDSEGKFTKSFVGAQSLERMQPDTFTYPFAGFDPRKIVPGDGCAVVDSNGNRIGEILTCATDMAIGRVDNRIISLATDEADGKPEDFQPRGLCCGFVRVSGQLGVGDTVYLTDGKRKIEVEIRTDIRPDRTARCPMKKMI
jgi:aminomethyltransferase